MANLKPDAESKEKISLFFSYANVDRVIFQIAELRKRLSDFPEIEMVYDWEESTENSFVEYMNNCLKKSDILILFCTENSLNSEAVNSEWEAAQVCKMPIIPIFMNKSHIPFLLAPHRGLEYNAANFDKFVTELHNLILKKFSHHRAFKPNKNTVSNDKVVLAKLKEVVNISDRVKLSYMAKFLNLTEVELFDKLVQWGKFLPIKLNEDIIIIEDKISFLNILEDYLLWIEGDEPPGKQLTQSNAQDLKPAMTFSDNLRKRVNKKSTEESSTKEEKYHSATWIFKTIVAGAGGVGKTSLIRRYVSGTFLEDHKMTIGAGFSIKDIVLDTGEFVRLQLWDFAGEERYRFLLGDYCKGACGAFIVYDITDYATFEQVPEWINIIRKNAGNIPIFIVGNKYDLELHEIELEQAEKYADEAKCILNVFCSAKLNLNVESMFVSMAKWLIYYSTLDGPFHI